MGMTLIAETDDYCVSSYDGVDGPCFAVAVVEDNESNVRDAMSHVPGGTNWFDTDWLPDGRTVLHMC